MEPRTPKWTRKEHSPYPQDWPTRQKAEEETERDLEKSVEQLLCDVHEEILNDDPNRTIQDNLLHANKRMVALMARAAIENRRTSRWLLGLTIAIAALTVVLVFKG